MAGLFLFIAISLISVVTALPSPIQTASAYSFPFVSREEWGARPSTASSPLGVSPVPIVVIHHSYIPRICLTRANCERDMRNMQRVHQVTNGWTDIGYNFAVGGEGTVFEGRGWSSLGAHTFGVNTRSIGILLIGDFITNKPPQAQLQSVKDLIEAGVRLGHIRSDYKLIGHRQVTPTECPGQRLFDEISKWDHFSLNWD
ncbi:peptidoglycan-recognition protein LB-like [Bombyx mandarina]|uniref:Peptidoglycan-recognition protein n=1 Tax=Bombyx mandarina TaxID=7092 RepID=A0A6J2K4U1_BOMMA|nr:peptidoglycan-recognition protein LB-like [Bombyx mandarina]XP_028035305.1 peptidoglycan-recognition protein LB-like [Bombyx mandarina]